MSSKRIQAGCRGNQKIGKPGARKGSALLIVIGTLALIAVFAAVYISIGRTDRRSARAVIARKDAVTTSNNFAEYFGEVIARDRLESTIAYGDGGAAGNSGFAVREITDAPYTDFTRRSSTRKNANLSRNRFLPSGELFSMGSLNGATDFRVASDPWLASTTPTFLGNPGMLNVDRPFSTYVGFSPLAPNAKNFLDNRDWLQISNFAPDGRFVNLFNLRPNNTSGFNTITVGSNEVGGFSAEPGVGTSPNSQGRQIRRMSNYLSLWNLNAPGDPESLIQTFDPIANGNQVWIPGKAGSGTSLPVNIGLTELWNVPAVWTMYQRYMYMPMNQPFITLNRLGDVSTWADPDYPAYQYADADGDGMADARWMELTAARDDASETTGRAREDVETLYNNKDYRFFIAARAVDLSSMVNVNTATDLLVPPTIDYPLGLTPADVDLRRLLTMQDSASDYTAVGTLPLDYSQLHRPYIGPGEPARGPWNVADGAQAGFASKHFIRNVSDYWVYRQESLGDPRQLTDGSNAMRIGRYAYDALRQGVILGSSLSDDYRGYDGTPPVVNAQNLHEYERNPLDYSASPAQITAEQRFNQYRDIDGINPTSRSVAWSTSADFGSGLYGLDDLAELLSFHGLNDPEVTTRLERVTTGRYQTPTLGGFNDVMQTTRLGPLLSNRSLELDRQQHGLALIDINSDPSAAPSSQNLNLREVNGRVSFNSMAHMEMTPRNKLTTISGSVPFMPTDFTDDPSIPEALTTTLTAAPSLRDAINNTGLLFQVYSNALAGEIRAPKPVNFMANTTYWPTVMADFDNHIASTLFYGHRGPELGLRIAAHTAVNMRDLADSDTDPTVATLILDNTEGAGLRSFVQAHNANVIGDAEYSLYPGAANNNLFDVGEANMATGNLPSKRQLVNVYGVEATPVITEVSVMYMYNDAPEAAGGDMDYSSASLPRYIGGRVVYTQPAPAATNITVSNAFDRANTDFLGQVLAFQLHNPYDTPISLGGTNYNGGALADGDAMTRHVDPTNDTVIDPASNLIFDYYIEYAGRFFKLGKYIDWYPTDQNSENYFAKDQNQVALAALADNPSNVYDPLVGGIMTPGSRLSADAPGSQAASSNFIMRNVVLQPGQTRVFYVIADRRFDDEGTGVIGRDKMWEDLLASTGDLPIRFTSGAQDIDGDSLADGGDGRGWTGPAEEWINHQFQVNGNGAGPRPVMMCEFDPNNGELVNEASAAFTDLTVAGTSILGDPSREDITEVRLWKKIVTKGEETTDIAANIDGVSSVTSDNLVSNDLLVDRLEIGAAGLNIPLTGTGDVSNTIGYPEDFPDLSTPQGRDLAAAGVRTDNTGIAFARWKTVRRADSATLVKPSAGQVTPWMLRSRNGTTPTQISHEHLVLDGFDGNDVFDANGGDLSDPSVQASVFGDYEIQENMRDFFDLYWIKGTGAGAIIQTIALEPQLKSDVSAVVGLGNVNEDDALNMSSTKFPNAILAVPAAGGANLEPGVAPAAVPVPEVMTRGTRIALNPRLGDLLYSWGIGATYAPDPTRGANSPVYVADEWMTVTEAMAVALGYDNPTATTGFEADSIWQDAYNQSGTQKQLLDDGHLVLDDFVSYLNMSIESPPAFTVSFPPATGDDIPRGTGVPTALGVFDQARAVERVKLATDPTGTLSARSQLELALARPTMGTININTAPIEVLRLLPGLTPSRQSYIRNGSTTREWWGGDPSFSGTNMPDGTDLTDLGQNPDIASAIIAYRDRTYGVPTTAARSDAVTSQAYDLAPLNFEPTNPVFVADNMRGESPTTATVPVAGTTDPLDRSTMTGIDGLRQAPGFGSLGELMAVRVDPDFETTDIARWDRTRNLSIDQLGYDNEFAGKSGQTTIMSQLFSGNDPGDTTDDYAEKLAMANAVLGTLSVRSDFYAVWFVIQGYQESDVANLRPEDPLIPTVRKRFLMVIDRSNVIEPGDKPKVLLMKELPL